MKRKDLIDNIEGSRLKKQFLEAFLLQSTYIEGLLKKILEDDFFDKIEMPIFLNSEKFENSEHLEILKKKHMKQNLSELIDFLFKTKVITKNLKRELHDYRENRNEVLHDLIGIMNSEDFENKIEAFVTKGQIILNDEIMITASESTQRKEDMDGFLRKASFSDMEEYTNKLAKEADTKLEKLSKEFTN